MKLEEIMVGQQYSYYPPPPARLVLVAALPGGR